MQYKELPEGFKAFVRDREEICAAEDGFCMDICSLAERLRRVGIPSLPGSDGRENPCDRFYDDWHVYAVQTGGDAVYGLVKLREQEHDAQQGLYADGDVPGVTVSFVGFDVGALNRCLAEDSMDNRRLLAQEIDRVVSRRGVKHDPRLKRYFADVRAQGAYCIARQYIRHVLSFVRDGQLEVPQRYAQGSGGRRILRFMQRNDEAAGYALCDGRYIKIKCADCPTMEEQYAVLATHTANTSFNSFAAEVRMHAQFLLPVLRIGMRTAFLYNSALRADMTIDGAGKMWFAPYYYRASACVRRQAKEHGAC